MNRLRLLCVFSGDTVLSICVLPGLFDRALSQPVLLVCAGVHFDVFGLSVGRTALVGVS